MTPRPSGRFSRSNALALALLAVGMTIFGSDKSPATRALQRFPSAPALTLDVDGGSASWDGDRREVVWDIQDTDHSLGIPG